MDWKWKNLIVAVVAAVMGWLSSIFVPAPGAAKPVAGVSQSR